MTVPYTYEGSDVSQISVMITSGAYDVSGTEILYYGKLDTDLSSPSNPGTGTFTLPDGLPGGYKMYILAEKVNGGKITDYASVPLEIAVETPAADLTEGTYSENKSVTLSSATAGGNYAAGTAPLSYQWMINRNDGNGWVNITNAISESYDLSPEMEHPCCINVTKLLELSIEINSLNMEQYSGM